MEILDDFSSSEGSTVGNSSGGPNGVEGMLLQHGRNVRPRTETLKSNFLDPLFASQVGKLTVGTARPVKMLRQKILRSGFNMVTTIMLVTQSGLWKHMCYI